MCYWVGTKKVREEMKKRFESGPQDEIAQLFYESFIVGNQEFKENYVNVGKGKPTLTTLIKDNGELEFQNAQWTLPYSYFDNKTQTSITRELINSTCERVFFQHKDIIYSKRCLVPIDGYFEFYHHGSETYPYYIYSSKSLFYAGGIWNKEINNLGESINTLSIITTPPNAMVAKIHNNPKAPNGSRMLLLIPENKTLDYLNEKLTKSEIEKFFQPYPQADMQAHPVMRFLKKENYQYLNSEKVLEEFNYPELVA